MSRLAGRRILIDGRQAGVVGGTFTHLVNVVGELLREEPEVSLRVLVGNERLRDALPASPRLSVLRLSEREARSRLGFALVSGARAARAFGADLYFSTGEFVPLTGRFPAIASFRNPNVFTALDQGWPLRQRARLRALRALARLACRRCERILFVSEDSARWIGDAMALPAARRAVVHHGIAAEAWSGEAPAPPLPRPYLLSVSSIYRYKNFVRLIEAWTRLARERPDAPDLAIVGNELDPPYAARMREARAAAGALAERIHLVGEVPYARVRAWYAGAALFVFPSYLETFGHPLLEAMAAGVPVVAADIPVFRELAADAALYADPMDAAAIARTLGAALDDGDGARLRVARGRERAAQFSWRRAATGLAGVFADVLAERGRAGATG